MSVNKIDWLLPENRIRATPLNLLKQGLENQQWEAISFAYLILTGEFIKPGIPTKNDDIFPSPADIKPKQEEEVDFLEEEFVEPEEDLDIEEEDDYVDSGSNEDEQDEEDDEEESPKKSRRSRIPARMAKVSAKGRKNKFVDNGIDAIEDNEFLPKKEVPASIRHMKRPSYQKIKVQCGKCGKRESIDPVLAPRKLDRNYRMQYRCNECSCGPGG